MEYTIKIEKKRPDVALYTDVIYKNVYNAFMTQNIPLKLHFMHPTNAFQPWKKLPLLIWLEGGAWRSCPPARRIPELAYYAYHGYAVASVQYSVSSQNLWPAQIEDAKEAVRFLKAHHEQFGIDPNRICVAGGSAGGHVAALTALTGGTEQFRTEEWSNVTDAVQAAVCLYCPGDFSSLQERGELEKSFYVASPERLLVNKKIEEIPELIEALSPKTYVTDSTVPFLFFHGTEDHLVPSCWSKPLYEEIIRCGGNAEYYNIEGAGHATEEFAQEEIQKIILAFLDQHIGNKS